MLHSAKHGLIEPDCCSGYHQVYIKCHQSDTKCLMIYTDVCVIPISAPLEREITLDPTVIHYCYFYWVLLFIALILHLFCFCSMQVVKQFTPFSKHPNTVVVKREMRVNGAKYNRPKLPSTQQYYSINQFLCTFTYNFIKICLENYYPNEKVLRGLLLKLQN